MMCQIIERQENVNRLMCLLLMIVLAMTLAGPVLAEGEPFATVTPAFDYEGDVGMVFEQALVSDVDGLDNYVLYYLATFLITVFGFFAFMVLMTKNLSGGFERLVIQLTSDRYLMDTLEAKYLAMPEGVAKDSIDLLAEIAKRLAPLTDEDTGAMLSTWLDQLRDGKPNDRASPGGDPGILNQ